MRKSRFTESQIVGILRELKSGVKAETVCRQNAFRESVNGPLRDECLNEYYFTSHDDVHRVLSQWRDRYNRERPHKALAWQTPEELANSFTTTTKTLHLSRWHEWVPVKTAQRSRASASNRRMQPTETLIAGISRPPHSTTLPPLQVLAEPYLYKGFR